MRLDMLAVIGKDCHQLGMVFVLLEDSDASKGQIVSLPSLKAVCKYFVGGEIHQNSTLYRRGHLFYDVPDLQIFASSSLSIISELQGGIIGAFVDDSQKHSLFIDNVLVFKLDFELGLQFALDES